MQLTGLEQLSFAGMKLLPTDACVPWGTMAMTVTIYLEMFHKLTQFGMGWLGSPIQY